ncbi:hypothetical protein K7432_009272 [Basidiobolus ranarum]|uniref:Cation-transporting P-type ATPase N-terminal domain-containing protein n=1 Tax=Basidiobolus ranarum TaxID=34480 RepID=A0ABR2VXT0_9FUNG
MSQRHGSLKKDKGIDIIEHLMNFEEVCQKYQTSANDNNPNESSGFSSEQATERLLKHGPNILIPPKKKTALFLYFECLTGLFNLLLIVSGVLQYVLLAINPADNQTNIYLGAILIGVAFVNAFIEFYQLQKSASILTSFLNLIPAKCFAIRDGRLNQIPAADLILGDVILVRMGDKVPADLLMFFTCDMKVDNSSLTSESEPQERVRSNIHKNPLEATNLAFNGTLVVSGEGYGIVIRTGDSTVLGQIAGLTQGEKKRKSPLTTEIDGFVRIIASIAFLAALIFFIVGQVLYGKIEFSLNFTIGVFVAWVPEGLPATVTMLLTISAKRMADAKVLVKDLKGVETLGAITLLTTDKTGTLTRNQMTVTNIWSGFVMYATSPASNPETPITADSQTYEYMASKGHRVLAFAQLLLPGDQFPGNFQFSKKSQNYPTVDLCFVGLTSLEDPPEHSVREAIGRCRSAGIQVMMVTGDHR